MTGILPDDRTTDKRPALFLESRHDDNGYNDLEDCRYRRLVLLVLLRLNSYLTPFQRGQAFRSELYPYSVFNVLKICFQLHCPTISQIEIFPEIARLSAPSQEKQRKTKNKKASPKWEASSYYRKPTMLSNFF